MLDTNKLCGLANVPVPTFQYWIDKGLIPFASKGGKGSNNRRQFTLMVSVGVLVGVRILHGEQSCSLTYLQKVVECFESITPAYLLKKFKDGETCFVMPHQGKPLLRGPQYDWVDVKEVFEQAIALDNGE